MRTVQIGEIQVPSSVIGYGTYHLADKLDTHDAITSFTKAYGAGINHFDTSDNYGTELHLGRAVSFGVFPREEVIIATKTGLGTTAKQQGEWNRSGRRYNTDPDRVRRHVDRSLEVMGSDVGYIDLYYLHAFDPNVESVDHAQLMLELKAAGKIIEYGLSNYTGEQLELFLETCDRHDLPRPAAIQPAYNLVYPDLGDIQLAQEEGIAVMAHSPLLKGALTTKLVSRIRAELRGIDAQRGSLANIGQLISDRLHYLDLDCQASGHNLARLAISWLVRQEGVVALCTPTNDLYLEDCLAGEVWDYTADPQIAFQLRALQANPSLDEYTDMMQKVTRQLRGY
ncbi:MAG: aldo/keto reductase [Patescibacteria group bacterium]